MTEAVSTKRSGTNDPDDDPTQRRDSDFAPTGVERKTGLWPTLKRTAQEFQEDNLTDWAASLTYYGLLALFPALIALVSIVGLVANPESTTNTLTDIVNQARARLGGEHVRGPDQAGDREPRHGGIRPRAQHASRPLVGLRLPGSVHPRLQRDLRDARGPPVLEAPSAAAR